jgi:hypothetical protein
VITTAVTELADAIRSGAIQAGADSPQVRGADWQTAVVTVVGTDGTVTAGGIIARRLASYTEPAVGDLIALTQSGAGSWLAVGVLAPGPPVWTTYTPVWSGLSVLGASVSSGRYQRTGATVHFVAALTWGTGGSLGTGTIQVTLPIAATSAATSDLGWQGTGRYNAGSGAFKSLVPEILPSATKATINAIRQTDVSWVTPGTAGYSWATGATMRIQGTYEI